MRKIVNRNEEDEKLSSSVDWADEAKESGAKRV